MSGMVQNREAEARVRVPETSAREKAAAARQVQVAAERHKRQLVIGGLVAAVIAALVAVGLLVQHNRATSDAALGTGPFVAPSGAVGTGSLAIPYGASPSAKVTLTIYEDYRCPYCRMAESMFESTYRTYAASGKIKVQYHLVDLIDRNLGGTGSLRAGNAGACAQDAGKFEAYHDVLYAAQPDENDDAYGSNAALITLAKQVGGLGTATFESCVNGGTHAAWVKKNYDSLSTLLNGSVATPYYAINGTQYKLTGQSPAYQQTAFKAALDSALTGAG
jgi:protein-disulfide isomerase